MSKVNQNRYKWLVKHRGACGEQGRTVVVGEHETFEGAIDACNELSRMVCSEHEGFSFVGVNDLYKVKANGVEYILERVVV